MTNHQPRDTDNDHRPPTRLLDHLVSTLAAARRHWRRSRARASARLTLAPCRESVITSRSPLPADRVDALAEQILDSGVTVRLINADVADMDDPDLDAAEMQRRLRTLVDLAQAVGTSTIMLPCGRQGTEPRTELSRDIATVARTLTAAADFVNAAGLDLLVEAPHSRRLCATVERSEMLYDALGESPRSAPCWTSVTSWRAVTTRSMRSAALTAELATCIYVMPSSATST